MAHSASFTTKAAKKAASASDALILARGTIIRSIRHAERIVPLHIHCSPFSLAAAALTTRRKLHLRVTARGIGNRETNGRLYNRAG